MCRPGYAHIAKKQGRNLQYSSYSPEIETLEEIHQEIQRDLYKALPRGEFEVHFQPLVNRAGAVAGFEALLRWTHPVHGPVSPVDFIPMAENADLLAGIGEWTFNSLQAMPKLAERGALAGPGVAVNVSATNSICRTFPGGSAEIVQECDLDPAPRDPRIRLRGFWFVICLRRLNN